MLEINGLPFVDEKFNSAKLLTIVAIVRKNIAGSDLHLNNYVQPDFATQLYRTRVKNSPKFPPHRQLSDAENVMLQKAKVALKILLPEWKKLLDIPIKIHKLLTQQTSLTNPMLPQQIFLGEAAFKSPTNLEETLVHELSHVWSSLIAEIYDFQIKNCSDNYTLPSGTRGKDARGVLLACLFAASALNYHEKLLASGSERAKTERIVYLQSYFIKSLQTLVHSTELSEMGRLITHQLEIFAKKSRAKSLKDNL